MNVLRIDPPRSRGHLGGSFGPDLHERETTSQLARPAGATAAVNSGFFVLDPAAGAPGDPAGAGVYDGRVLSEAVDGAPPWCCTTTPAAAPCERLTWGGTARIDGSARRSTGSTGCRA